MVAFQNRQCFPEERHVAEMAGVFHFDQVQVPCDLLVHDRIAHVNYQLEDSGVNWILVLDCGFVSCQVFWTDMLLVVGWLRFLGTVSRKP